MRPLRHGIDATSISRVQEKLNDPDVRWRDRVYSVAERECADDPPMHCRFFASRYACKEAVVKALGTGFAGDITWHNIEILRGGKGEPYIKLNGAAALLAQQLGITGWLVSISYCGDIAFGSVIAVAD